MKIIAFENWKSSQHFLPLRRNHFIIWHSFGLKSKFNCMWMPSFRNTPMEVMFKNAKCLMFRLSKMGLHWSHDCQGDNFWPNNSKNVQLDFSYENSKRKLIPTTLTSASCGMIHRLHLKWQPINIPGVIHPMDLEGTLLCATRALFCLFTS